MTSTFGAESTAAEIVRDYNLQGKSAVVTGAASGIGVETARALAGAGAAVTLAVRDTTAGSLVAADIRATAPDAIVSVQPLDLASIKSVDRFTATWSTPLHILINNAGVMNTPMERTGRGWESQFAINHLGHFALATGLHEALTAANGARVVSVSSSGHGDAGIDFDDPFFTRRAYDSSVAYGQSKTANVLFAVEAAKRWKNDHIIVKAVMPGGVWTNLQRHWDPSQLATMRTLHPGKTPEQGAATSVFAAVDDSVTSDGPVYYEDCHPAAVVDRITDGLHGVVRHALDPVSARRLWDLSSALLEQERQDQ